MQALLDQVLETEGALRCPHGRPTMLLLSREQLDRQFGRI
jgi:DNA mismatch repair protein MutL